MQIDEATKVIEVLTKAGFKPKIPVQAIEFADKTRRKQWIEAKGMQVFSMYNPAQPALTIDLFVEYPIPFVELWLRSVVLDLGKTTVRVYSNR